MPIFNEELCGPVAAICKVENFLEAIALANRSEFGLGTNVFTNELSEAIQAVEDIEAGMVFVNNRLIDNDVLLFRGWKNSGTGRSLNRRGLDAFSPVKKWRSSSLILIRTIGGTPIPLTFFYPNT